MNAQLKVEIFRNGRLIWFLSVAIVVATALNFLNAFPSAAADTFQDKVDIATILANPKEYILRKDSINATTYTVPLFSLEGTVRDAGLSENDGTCYQRFILADDSGSIPAIYNLFCNVAKQNDLILSSGDRIVVDGYLRYNTLDGKGNLLGVHMIVRKFSRR